MTNTNQPKQHEHNIRRSQPTGRPCWRILVQDRYENENARVGEGSHVWDGGARVSGNWLVGLIRTSAYIGASIGVGSIREKVGFGGVGRAWNHEDVDGLHWRIFSLFISILCGSSCGAYRTGTVTGCGCATI